MSGPPVHSSFVTDILSDRVFAADFFQALLPGSLADVWVPSTLAVEDASLVDPELREFRSDLLFTVQTKFGKETALYILFEHKSRPDPDVLNQLFKYLYLIHARRDVVVPIVPVLLYHGSRKWNLPRRFMDSFRLDARTKTAIEEFALDFRYVLIDANQLHIDELALSLEHRAFLEILRGIWTFDDPVQLGDYLEKYQDLFFNNTQLQFLEKLLVYIFRVQEIEPRELRDLIKTRISQEKEGIIMSTAEKLEQQGILKGRLEGRLEGKLEGKLEDAANFLANGVSLEIVLKSTGLTHEQLLEAGIIDRD